LNVNLISWDTTSLGFWKYNILNDTWIKISVTENPNLLGLHKKDLMKSNVNTILMPMNFDAINKLKSNFRNTDVFFSGRINSYRDYRNPFISVLKSIKCDLYLNIINNNTDLIPYEEIYRKLNNSKIGVNFAISTNSNQQLKGRAWETLLCGALLLEQENDQILNYFEPNIDFVFFSTPDDLKEKILFYLKNPLELSKVACSGNKKARLLQENNRFEYIF
jgi:spore maturation protein CgeB